jgi:CheY-like chemotaxis protein
LIRTPVARSEPTPPTRGDNNGVLSGIDILLVDDDEQTLTLFRDSLEAAGATVRAVMTAADALRQHDNRLPDLLVTDLGLPGTDGLELLQAIRTKSPNIPAVAVTRIRSSRRSARALGSGFQAHVSKPIDPASFVHALAAVSQAE